MLRGLAEVGKECPHSRFQSILDFQNIEKIEILMDSESFLNEIQKMHSFLEMKKPSFQMIREVPDDFERGMEGIEGIYFHK